MSTAPTVTGKRYGARFERDRGGRGAGLRDAAGDHPVLRPDRGIDTVAPREADVLPAGLPARSGLDDEDHHADGGRVGVLGDPGRGRHLRLADAGDGLRPRPAAPPLEPGDLLVPHAARDPHAVRVRPTARAGAVRDHLRHGLRAHSAPQVGLLRLGPPPQPEHGPDGRAVLPPPPVQRQLLSRARMGPSTRPSGSAGSPSTSRARCGTSGGSPSPPRR